MKNKDEFTLADISYEEMRRGSSSIGGRSKCNYCGHTMRGTGEFCDKECARRYLRQAYKKVQSYLN